MSLRILGAVGEEMLNPGPALADDVECVSACKIEIARDLKISRNTVRKILQQRIQLAKGCVSDRPVAQSWVGSSALASSSPRGPANPVSALGPRLRGDADESRWPQRPPLAGQRALAGRRARGKVPEGAAQCHHGPRLGRELGQ
jgi:hypothetical protein